MSKVKFKRLRQSLVEQMKKTLVVKFSKKDALTCNRLYFTQVEICSNNSKIGTEWERMR